MLPLIGLAIAAAPLPACAPEALSLAFDGENGAFDGMSHGGALLVIRNIGARPCAVAALPRLIFSDATGTALPIARRAAAGSGPPLRPVGIAAGAELTAPLRWIAGEVYERSRCFEPVAVAVAIGKGSIRAAVVARICGPASAAATFDQPVLRPDPVLK